ncbi:MAG: ABC-type transport auxiliary lipoprotein family protein [Alphaproteobacteria bacterium]|nr:ABC-type transport auxiliary lipoprotein family protein [Alphaproteobacteria bacterium]
MIRQFGGLSRAMSRSAFFALCLLLAACVDPLDLVSGAPPRLFELTPKSTFDRNLPKVSARLAVDVPTATAGLNTARIALKPTLTQFDYYAGARWVDVVPVMTQNLLLESFDNSQKIDVLGRGAYGLRADFGLLVNIREFQAEYDDQDASPEVRVRFQARMVAMPRRTHIASTSVVGLATAESRKLDDIIDAFDQAFGRAAKDLVDWTIRRAAQDMRS